MNKTNISMPPGILYLGNYPELINQLPQGSFIFNKVMTGCGATTMFLKDSVPTILCSPRKEMIYCKATSDDFVGRVHLFGAQSPKSDVLTKINDMKHYVQSTLPTPFGPSGIIPKILVTYDSTKHVLQGLDELGYKENFRIVVDEFQTLFTDAAFRGDTEAEFMEKISNIELPTVYLSATPYIEDYLDQLDNFKNLPYVELVWPDSSKHHTNVVSRRYIRGSKKETITGIIEKYRTKGYFEELMDSLGNICKATQAVFFVNDVSFIKSVIEKNKLKPDDTLVICADCSKNEKTLSKVGFKIGHAPKENHPHPTFTFATKCAYEGTDFYHPNAYTYVFSEIRENLANMAIDISLDLPQILGRLRSDNNVFKYSATLFYKTVPEFSVDARNEFYNKIKEKDTETREAVNDFNNTTDKRKRNREARKYRNAQKVEKYQNDYISVVDDKENQEPVLVFNMYVMLNEIRAWQVQRDQFLNGTYVMNSVSQAFSNSTTVTSQKVNVFLSTYCGTFEECMKMYAEFLDTNPECKGELQMCTQVPICIKEYYNILGTDRLRALSWKEANIRASLNAKPMQDTKTLVLSEFTSQWYSLSDIKKKLQKVYETCSPGRIAKATDIKDYFMCKESKRKIADGKRENGYELIKPIIGVW